jgi:glycosyltransferase involved in cell wall biosynthesis
VLSIYEGFFTGGARALHSSVVTGLHAMGAQEHSVLSIHSEMHRETIVQRMDDDPRYHRLSQAGVRITSLDRRPGHATDPRTFTEAELAVAASQAIRADVILSLKEQPLHLVNQVGFPNRPVIVCLHRSDPENQGQAMAELKTAIADGRVAACICCAESTKTSYQAAGIPAELLHVIPNGVDVSRFRPVTASKRARLRRSLGVPTDSTVIVFAARYDPMKNTSLFLRAAKEFLKRRGRGRVLMCGAGMSTTNALLDDDVRAAFGDAPHLLKRLRLLGIRNDMESVYAAADVVSLTSSVGEAAPLCLIEGMMCGAIPVATDIGDCAAIVAGHGLITPPDAMAIAAAWIEAVERRAEFAPALIRSRVRFSQTRMIDSYSALIHQIYRQVGHAAR